MKRIGFVTLCLFAVAILSSCSVPSFEAQDLSSLGSIKSLTESSTSTPPITNQPAPSPQPIPFLSSPQVFSLPSCGSHNWVQVPDQTDLFIGRALPANDCTSYKWNLVLGKMDWTNKKIVVLRPLLSLPAKIQNGKYTITVAYDPSVIRFNNELWVAFECNGENFPGTFSTCMAPWDPNAGLDIHRAYVAVQGISYETSNPEMHSASVPKLMTYKDQAYLYWTTVRMNKTTLTWAATDALNTRGVQLTFDPEGRLVPVAHGAEMPADHPFSFLVFGTNPKDPRASTVADAFQIINKGDYFYLVGAVGGKGCLAPMDKTEGCYRLTVRRSSSPLGHLVFNDSALADTELVANPHEYSHFLKDPNGKYLLGGAFFSAIFPSPQNTQATGYTLFSVSENSTFFSPSTKNSNPLLSLSSNPRLSVINEAFRMFYKRPAQNTELLAHIESMAQGLTNRGFILSLYNSAEFQNKIKSFSDGDFVYHTYDVLLQRKPDSEGYNYFLNLLTSGQSTREHVFQLILGSDAFKQQHPYLAP